MKFSARRQVLGKVPERWRYGEGTHCYWCNISVHYGAPAGHPAQATREHFLPRSLGGGGGKNIAVACARCNHGRGANTDWIPWHQQPENRRRLGVPMVRA